MGIMAKRKDARDKKTESPSSSATIETLMTNAATIVAAIEQGAAAAATHSATIDSTQPSDDTAMKDPPVALAESPPLSPGEPAADAADRAGAAPIALMPRASTSSMADAPPPPAAEPERATISAAPPRANDVPTRGNRFALLAASVALAASIGALAGSFASVGLTDRLHGAPAGAQAGADGIRALKDEIAALQASNKTLGDELAGLRTGVGTWQRTTTAQLGKLTERSDGDAARVTKTTEAIDRIERRLAAAGQGDITGTITPPATKPAIIDGWTLRRVYDGFALIRGRFGEIEVEPGAYVPGIGRIEDIHREDGRWVVVTSRGLIVARR
jgi:hypothetical protein